MEQLAKEDIDFDGCKAKVASFDQKAWERCVRDHFEGAAQGVIELEQKAGKNDIEKAKQRIDHIQKHWDTIKECYCK